ncbi:MAG: ABC transporter ATP-binding protein [Mariprofundaceae bacterium]|nr:ABC transporter ATP-binding protein [Mariprofundaceae bacterium]
MSGLKTDKLTLSRGGRLLLHDLDVQLNPGRVTVVLGPNGAGKSSLLLALAGMLAPDAGSVMLGSRSLDVISRSELARIIGWQGGMPPTEFGLSVEQRLMLAMQGGLNAAEGDSQRENACESMEVLSLRQRALGELSSGERQRVELAAMLVRDCPIWLLDEPCAHLDIRHQVAWVGIMRRQARRGKAVLAVLHDVQQAAAIADDVMLIYGDGRVACGAAQDLLRADVLSDLLQTGLRQLGDGVVGDRVLLPDYHCGESVDGL